MDKVVNVNAEVDAITKVIGTCEGPEAPRERVDAVVGKNVDDESEIGEIGIGDPGVEWGSESENRVRLRS